MLGFNFGPVPPELPAGPLEAMAAELNPRGLPYRLNDMEFPPGVWVDVTPGQAAQLQLLPWATVRPKEKANV